MKRPGGTNGPRFFCRYLITNSPNDLHQYFRRRSQRAGRGSKTTKLLALSMELMMCDPWLRAGHTQKLAILVAQGGRACTRRRSPSLSAGAFPPGACASGKRPRRLRIASGLADGRAHETGERDIMLDTGFAGQAEVRPRRQPCKKTSGLPGFHGPRARRSSRPPSRREPF